MTDNGMINGGGFFGDESPEWSDALEMLSTLSDHGWKLYAFGDRTHPDVLAAVQQFAIIADVIVVRGHDRVAGYRTITAGTVTLDPLRAEQVIWHYLGHAGPVARAILGLRLDVDCGSPYPIPDECRVPEVDSQPITIRYPR